METISALWNYNFRFQEENLNLDWDSNLKLYQSSSLVPYHLIYPNSINITGLNFSLEINAMHFCQWHYLPSIDW